MGTVNGRELMVSGEWYQDDTELREQRRRCARLLERFNTAGSDQDHDRADVLHELLASIDPGATVMPRFTCSYGDQIRIGADALINYDCLLMDDAAIDIGDGVLIGPPGHGSQQGSSSVPGSPSAPTPSSAWEASL